MASSRASTSGGGGGGQAVKKAVASFLAARAEEKKRGTDRVPVEDFPNPGYAELNSNLAIVNPNWYKLDPTKLTKFLATGKPPSVVTPTHMGAYRRAITEAIADEGGPTLPGMVAALIPTTWLENVSRNLGFTKAFVESQSVCHADIARRAKGDITICWLHAVKAHNANMKILKELYQYAISEETKKPYTPLEMAFNLADEAEERDEEDEEEEETKPLTKAELKKAEVIADEKVEASRSSAKRPRSTEEGGGGSGAPDEGEEEEKKKKADEHAAYKKRRDARRDEYDAADIAAGAVYDCGCHV